jgi:hypothetical protein
VDAARVALDASFGGHTSEIGERRDELWTAVRVSTEK